MTFEQAKDQVAKNYTKLNLNWDNVWTSYGRQITAEAAELYARSMAAQAWEEGYIEGWNHHVNCYQAKPINPYKP